MSQRRQRNVNRENEARRARPARVAAGAGLALGASFVVAAPAQAADFTVTNLNESGPGSLRDAIDQANAAPGADTILFQAGLTGSINLLGGGDIEINESLEIRGPGANQLAVSGNSDSRIFDIYPTQQGTIDVTISGLQLRQGSVKYGTGGDIRASSTNLTITDSQVRTGNAAAGGGIFTGGGNLTVRDSTISGNQSFAEGGGILFADYGQDVAAIISGSTINNNSAANKYGGNDLNRLSADQPFGGGGMSAFGSVTISRSTIANNTTAGNGGGVLFEGFGEDALNVRSSTVSGNAAGAGGGIYSYIEEQPPAAAAARRAPGDPNLESTIVAGNEADGPQFGHDLGGGPFNAAFSLIQRPEGTVIDASVAGSNLFDVNPRLGALADNGGTTRTMRLSNGSPALDAGRTPTGENSDQRGVERPIDLRAADNAAGGDGADIGAYERRARPPAPPPPGPSGTCKGKDATLSGTNGRDFLRGTPQRDVIRAGGGNDIVRGLGGNDLICLGAGIDVGTGGGGGDRIYGQAGNDRIFGQRGRDHGEGGAGADILAGGDQADELHGNKAKDRVLGAAGNDRLFGEQADDVVLGARGNDFIRGGPGSDRLSGGTGINDVQQ